MPLSTNAKLGLIAVAVAAGLLLVCGGGAVGVYLLTQRGPATGGSPGPADGGGKGKPLAERPISDGNPKGDESYILGHRWWKRPPTRERLNEIVNLIIAANAGTAVFIDDTGRTGRATQYNRDAGWWDLEPENLGQRRLCIEARWAVRPDRKKVLGDIRTELDIREYRDGPGR